MIFVTVGTFKFDELIQKIDALALEINEKIVCQIGNGIYEPRNVEYFRFAPSLYEYYEKSRIIIGHGGAGTIFELLNFHKHFIGVSSNLVTENHQDDLLKKLSSDQYILWCKDLSELRGFIELSKSFQFRQYIKPECTMDKVIIDFLKRECLK
jgi:beta-1,4-N-acetylglucosaminyltransferase